MTQLPLLSAPLVIDGDSLTARVARLFLDHPGEWLTMQELAKVGGTGGWRTRVSDCRQRYRMRIDNRTEKRVLANGHVITWSAYRYLPEDAE